MKLGHGAGELLLAVADGMDSPLLAARAPFDLIIANILAGPLIELAPDFARALAPGGTVVLAGLLDTQADAVASAYEAQGLTLRERGSRRMAGARLRTASLNVRPCRNAGSKSSNAMISSCRRAIHNLRWISC